MVVGRGEGVGGSGCRWDFQGYLRNSKWNFQGLIKNNVKFPDVIKKKTWNFQGSWF